MNKKMMLLGLISFLLNGCSPFYGYQSPAPIYGKSKGTNPYQRRADIPARPIINPRETYNTPESELGNAQELPVQTEELFEDEEEMVTRRVSSPAVLALVSDAERSSKAGDLESAVTTIERALRIDSRNPSLIYKLAKLRLQQSKPRLAEDLAKKAALLSANDRGLKRKSWLLISEARKQQENYYGANEARIKADRF